MFILGLSITRSSTQLVDFDHVLKTYITWVLQHVKWCPQWRPLFHCGCGKKNAEETLHHIKYLKILFFIKNNPTKHISK